MVVATSVLAIPADFGGETFAILAKSTRSDVNMVPPVRLEPRLSAEARAHARDMSKYDYLGTPLPNGDAFEHALVRAGYAYRRMYVSVAAGHPTPLGVVASWASEDTRRQQLLDAKVADVGVGYAAKAEVSGGSHLDYFWVVTLAEPLAPFNGNWRREVLDLVNGLPLRARIAPIEYRFTLEHRGPNARGGHGRTRLYRAYLARRQDPWKACHRRRISLEPSPRKRRGRTTNTD